MSATRPRVMLVGGSDVDARLELMQHLRDEFDVAALGSAPALAGRFRAQGFAYDAYPLGHGRVSPVADLRALGELVRVFRRRRPEVVHAFDTKPGIWGCLAARLAGVPVVVGTVNGLGFLVGSENARGRLVWAIYRRLQALASGASDATVFQNHDDAHQLIADGVVPARKAKVILGSGVSTERFSRGRVSADACQKVREELGIRPGDTVVTMISRVIRSKGVLDFAAAARSIGAARSDVRFVLVGPRESDSMDRLSDAEVRELEAAVTWPGVRRDVPAVLAVSDVAALPTAYREGLPRVLLEAGSMGLPIVTTDSPGCNEVVEDGVNGFLTPVGDTAALTRAIQQLVDEPELRSELGRRSRERIVERFDLAAIAAETSALYYELLEQELAPPERAAR